MILRFLFFIIFIETVRLQEYSENEILDKAANDMKFAIYTRKNPNQTMLFNLNGDSLKNTTFDKDKPVKMLIHGWQGHFLDVFNTIVKNEYLIRYDANVISVDYSKDARPFWYFSVRNKVPLISAVIAYLMDRLVFDFGVDPDHIHVIGYSLGGHVGGVAGLKARKKIGRATGLDPASIAFSHSTKLRLRKSSAKFVDVIHCDAQFGYTEPLGHVDFFPNGGRRQFVTTLIDQESHFKSYPYFAETINKPGGFMAMSCPSWAAFQRDECPLDAQITEMGEHVNLRARGSFYLTTNKNPPYAKGEASLIYNDS